MTTTDGSHGEEEIEELTPKKESFENSPSVYLRKSVKSQFDKKESQEKRRQELLASQQMRRDELLEKIRQLETELFSDSEFEEDEDFATFVEESKMKTLKEHDEDEGQNIQDVEEMDTAAIGEKANNANSKKRIRKKHKKKRDSPCGIMLSEWMLEKPDDFEDKWIGTYCPVGKRCLVVANRGKTKVFSRTYQFLGIFQSSLPGGRKLSQRDPEANRKRGVTILDCVWNKSSEAFYALDVISWNSQSTYNCDKAFRHFFLTSKLEENNPSCTAKTLLNPFPFVPLPYFECSLISDVMMNILPSFHEKVDGVLFFHKDSFYHEGVNPLVTWIYLTAVEERLQVPVSPELIAKQKSHKRRGRLPQKLENQKKELENEEME